MATTPRFKLNTFGGTVPGSLNQDGQKYTGLDRLVIDRLLAQTEVHDHKFRPSGGLTLAAPTGVLQTEAGSLQGGYTYHYRYAVVDAQGAESIASAEVHVETPALLPIPGLPGASADAGTGGLAPGMYYYALTALRGAEETPLGAASLVAVQPGQDVTLELPPFGDAEAVRVWRLGSTETGYTKIAVVPAGAETFVDDGAVAADPCACDPGNQPPNTNTGTAAYAVAITLPEDVSLATARSWRLYRTVYPGIYPTTSLVHEVVEREAEWDETSPLMRVWIDTGGPAVAGKPMDSDQNMRFQAFTLDSADVLPDAGPYPSFYPLIVGTELYVKIDGAWTLVTGAGEGGGGGVTSPTPTQALTAPDGSRWELVVDETGALSTVSTLFPGPPTAPQNVSVLP